MNKTYHFSVDIVTILVVSTVIFSTNFNMAFPQNSNQNMMMDQWLMMNQLNPTGMMGMESMMKSQADDDALYDDWTSNDGKPNYVSSNALYGESRIDRHGTTNDGHGTTNDGHGTTNDGHGTTNDGHGTTNDGHGTTNDGHGTTNDESIEPDRNDGNGITGRNV